MIKYGTHNSLSYLKPQWWLRPFNWIGKCQSLNIAEQYKLGVRYFDIRIKYTKEGKAISGHGLLTYNINIESILLWLNTRKSKCIVRLYLENSKYNPRKYDNYFQRDIELWTKEYSNITFVEGGCRYEYKQFIPNNIEVNVCYAEYWKKKFCIPFPRLQAKMNNHLMKLDNNKYNIFDYIQYGNNKET